MKRYALSEITTKDGLIHQGLYFRPENPGKKAMLWIHGLTGTFYGNVRLLEELANECDKYGMGFAAFNNRGHDLIAGIRKRDRRTVKGYRHIPGGAGYEQFTQSVFDIDAGIDFLMREGYEHIVIAGHSTGANKACYYGAYKRNSLVSGIILLSPISDRLVPSKPGTNRMKDLEMMKQLIAEGKGNDALPGYHFFPITPRRFVSLFGPLTHEDIFDYGDSKPKLTAFSRIRKPVLVVFGGDDEAADRPIASIKAVFDSRAASALYESVVIPGALHSFNGQEKVAAETVLRFCSRI